jgi:hypothetical protein
VKRYALRLLFGFAAAAALLSTAWAQEEGKKEPPKKEEPKQESDPEGYRQFFKKPENAAEFWRAIQFEIEVGKYDLAAKHLRGLMESKPDEASLLELQDRVGMSGFLRLRNVVRWSANKEAEQQARKDVDDLIALVSDALRKLLNDPKRIEKYVANLQKSQEEKEYAIKELYRSGAAAVPYLLESLKELSGDERANVVEALEKLGPDTIPPLLAALDAEDNGIVLDLIRVLRKRGATRATEATLIAPGLWYLTSAPKRPKIVHQAAREALGYLTNTHPDKLLPGKFALTREAERYFQHKVPLQDPTTVWRWEGGKLVRGWPGAETVPPARAEEYYGLYYAGKALDLDPTYPPAQVVFLTLALERAVQRGGFDQPLAKTAPEVNSLLTTVSPDLINVVLERALAEQRLPVIVGAVRVLGDLADTRAALPTTRGEPALVRALLVPDRRVQMAAADTILRLPVRPSSVSTPRVVEILRRAVAADPGVKTAPKVLVVHFNEDVLREMSGALQKAGFEPIRVRTGRDAMRRLNEAADIEAILVDASVAEPQLPYFLGEVRADIHGGLLPVVVLTPREHEAALRRAYERYRNVWFSPPVFGVDAEGLKKTLPELITQAMGQPLSEAEQKANAETAILWLARLAKGEKPGYDVQPTADTVLGVLRNGQMSEAAQAAAIEIAGRLPGTKPQQELANFVLDPKRPLALRNAAAAELVKHIQLHGPVLSAPMLKGVQDQFADATVDPGLRANLGLVIGSMRPDARTTGERLKGFRPPPPAAPKPPMPPKEPEPPKEKDPPKDS